MSLMRLGAAGVLVIASGAGLAASGDLRLIQAVRSQDVELARVLVAEGIDVNETQADGSTALHWAAHRNDLTTTDLLIEAGADVRVVNDLGTSPLQVACETRSGPMVERLLAAGAPANATLLNGETTLMSCARTGDARSVAALLAHGARVNEVESGHQQTALMWAAAQGHPVVVRLLLDAGADVRARSLTYARTVVDEQTQRAGREELNYTVLRGGSTPLLFAARNGDAASARLLLDAGAEPNDALSDGMSALTLAAHSGHSAVGVALLEAGANPNNIGIGYTALHAAVLRSRLDLVEALLAFGAAPNIRMTRGTPLRRNTTDFNLPKTLVGATPYLLAAKLAEAQIMRALVAGGADPGLTMPDSTTALLLAAGLGTRQGSRRGISPLDVGGMPEPESQVLEAVRAAVELGAAVNAGHPDGTTPLHQATSNEHPTVVRFLAEQGADVNARNGRGLTPLALLTGARARRDAAGDDGDAAESATVQLLRELGATQHNQLVNLKALLAGEVVVDRFEVELDRFSNLTHRRFNGLPFANTAREAGHVCGVAAVGARFQNNLQLHGRGLGINAIISSHGRALGWGGRIASVQHEGSRGRHTEPSDQRHADGHFGSGRPRSDRR